MRTTLFALTAALALTACEGWGTSHPAIWDARDVVAAQDGLYVRLLSDRSGVGGSGLVHVRPDGASIVDVGPGELSWIALAPDDQTAVGLVRRTRCEPRDPKDARGARYVRDCPTDARKIRGDLIAVSGGEVTGTSRVSPHYNTVTFSNDARWAIVWLDATRDIDVRGIGVVDLTSVQVVDLATFTTTPVSVGFAASRVLFTEDGNRAVVLSQDSVALIELTAERPARGTVFPLTLEAGQTFTPVGVGLTPDGRYALVTALGRDDLYALRLDPPSINLVNLSGRPAAMAILPPTNPAGDRATDPLARDDRTVIVHESTAAVDLVEHDSFDVDSLSLSSLVNRIEHLGRTALLWRQNEGFDAYHLDLGARRTTRFRLQNPASNTFISPGRTHAIALTRPRGGGGAGIGGLYANSPGLEILDLRDDRGRTTPFLLEDIGVGLAFTESDVRLDALVLQRDTDYLLELDLLTLRQQELQLIEAPVAIGALPATSGFWVTHDAPLGLISFYDPATGEINEVGGFAAYGLLEGVRLDTSEGE